MDRDKIHAIAEISCQIHKGISPLRSLPALPESDDAGAPARNPHCIMVGQSAMAWFVVMLACAVASGSL